MKNKYILFKANGNAYIRKGETDKPSLEFMQKCVSGHIERVFIPALEVDGIDIYVNDEGAINNMPFNTIASVWVNCIKPEDLGHINLFGDILLVSAEKNEYDEMESCWLNDEQVRSLMCKHHLAVLGNVIDETETK